ncbi:hypothetical protein RHMOL_Rhmol04G0154700 [Rhododendron molle]|uniref:Uncharacterized protein n=1 Tax=Rhododendron molle TaxID=49168 RepID=A0ACC0P153_RHOML|nr:hypothetical protein RHMOL_Rhmol04G0154700 [Rhododendron molle]
MDSFSFLFVLDFKVWKEFLISNMDSLSFEDPKSVIIVSMYSATLYSGNKCGQAQQRVFAVQVFELHRLIKVQKLIAASLELLLQSELHLGMCSPLGAKGYKLGNKVRPRSTQMGVGINPTEMQVLEDYSEAKEVNGLSGTMERPRVSLAWK